MHSTEENGKITANITASEPCFKSIRLDLCFNCTCVDAVTKKSICCDSPGTFSEVAPNLPTQKDEIDLDCVLNIASVFSFMVLFLCLIVCTACRNSDTKNKRPTLPKSPSKTQTSVVLEEEDELFNKPSFTEPPVEQFSEEIPQYLNYSSPSEGAQSTTHPKQKQTYLDDNSIF
ncbi:hypothetical protein Bpfe_029352 [Biomphalaria pfeifferi]|uniref:Uncharacterized protein n=1 Tax=Biomphalaria pfeifferi TaxID=112525 RepID=A0AAD8ATB0_BIOPF|nr:hypothetical protein Bpfe_029352 [Biomphalaria pfeifferi]